MGAARFVSRKTGEELEAEFPLNPILIKATKADGNTVQFMRDAWDQEFQQKLPELPQVDASSIPKGYDPPSVVPVGAPMAIMRPPGEREPLPDSHASWYALIYDQLVTMDRKIDRVLAQLEAGEVDVETTPAPPTEPPPQG